MRQRVSVVIIENKKLLLVRGKENFFSTPGGKIEEGETDKEAIIRELSEELHIAPVDITPIISYEAIIQGTDQNQTVKCFQVTNYTGTLKPSKEISEVFWYSKDDYLQNTHKVPISIFTNLLPKLIEMNLL